jgi:3',5'-cyclic AMP phosphodiesterase CpdA
MLATHHPVMAPPATADFAVVGRAKLAVRAVTEAGVRLVLAGHHHRAFSADLPVSHLVAGRSIHAVQAGTAISTRLRAEPNSYNLLHIAPTRVSCAVQVFQRGRFVTASQAEYASLGDRWVRQ